MFFAPATRNERQLSDAGRMDQRFDRFMQNAYGGAFYSLDEDDQSWTLTLDVPGIAKEHLNVSIEGCFVRLETSPEARRSLRAAYELPHEIDPDRSEAKLENGVLSLRLGKPAHAMRRQLMIG